MECFLSGNRELGLGFRCALGFWMTTCFAQVHIALHAPSLLCADCDGALCLIVKRDVESRLFSMFG
jgi:hypothetical protein